MLFCLRGSEFLVREVYQDHDDVHVAAEENALLELRREGHSGAKGWARAEKTIVESWRAPLNGAEYRAKEGKLRGLGNSGLDFIVSCEEALADFGMGCYETTIFHGVWTHDDGCKWRHGWGPVTKCREIREVLDKIEGETWN